MFWLFVTFFTFLISLAEHTSEKWNLRNSNYLHHLNSFFTSWIIQVKSLNPPTAIKFLVFQCFIKASKTVLEASSNCNEQKIRDLHYSSFLLRPENTFSLDVSVLYIWLIITHGAMLQLTVMVYLLDHCCVSLCTLW